MGINEDREFNSPDEILANEVDPGGSDEHHLLDAVLRETIGDSDREALDLIFAIARKSSYEDTTHIEAVEEVVQAIIKYRFGNRQFTPRLIHRIACSLIEAPEATVKLERLWQEARASG